ncbi:MAG: bifunctional adenosylcobinamide kinase/adenosylcobinamide-phosphate guanylyltransferase [Deltaproteobacteria bacterium GWA2_55_10]|nr:MAG: bifunctional adenosylcobinamide kinase/adenosylcobinamide-phosphate guanylyltransferase [Deltaproteobacteria bacterium GWA2_55_10]
MSGKFSFIVGGARSGKSAFSMELAAAIPGPKVYIATAEALDTEMDDRIRKHQDARGEGWETIEETLELSKRIAALGQGRAIVIDCLTLWVSNLIAKGLPDEAILARARDLFSACADSLSSVIAVSNEVGLGIVPDNALARRFRDIAGIVNQEAAKAASEVWFVASGIPMRMK